MAEKIFVTGYDEFLQFVKELKTDTKKISFLFTGAKQDGVSWCPDCVEAEPFIDDALEKFCDNDTVLVTVDVGDRPTWKDAKNSFRMDKDTHLSVIPTLIRWKNPQRLEGEQLLKEELLQMFFADED